MKVPIGGMLAALTAAVLAGVAGAQDFSITELTTFSGTLPCPNCAGIKLVVSLRPDGFYYLQRTYMRNQLSGQRVLEIGAWTASAGQLKLNSTLGETQNFEIQADGALRMLDRDGKSMAPDGNSVLPREPQAHVPLGTYKIRGIYTQGRGRSHFQPCGSTVRFPVETGGRAKLLERLSQATAGGKPALLTIFGTLETSAAQSGASSAEIVRIASVLSSEPGGSCGPAPLSALPATGSVFLPVAFQKVQSDGQKSQNETASPLIETPWVLTELANRPVANPSDQREAGIRFMAQGHVTGSTGCNRFTGTFTSEGHLLRFGPLSVTQIACPDGAGVEAEYLKALDATRQFQIHGDTLNLLDEAGHNAARFKAIYKRRQELPPK